MIVKHRDREFNFSLVDDTRLKQLHDLFKDDIHTNGLNKLSERLLAYEKDYSSTAVAISQALYVFSIDCYNSYREFVDDFGYTGSDVAKMLQVFSVCLGIKESEINHQVKLNLINETLNKKNKKLRVENLKLQAKLQIANVKNIFN